MEKYDYERSIIRDILDYIHDSHITIDWTDTEDNIVEDLIDILWNEDCITGNGSNYYDTEEKCFEYLCSNVELLYEAAYEFCLDDDVNIVIYHYQNKTLARYFDSSIRCYLLSSCIYQAVQELKKEEYENFFRELDNE